MLGQNEQIDHFTHVDPPGLSGVGQDAVVVSAVCFVRQFMVRLVERVAALRVCGEAATLEQVLERVGADMPVTIFLDAAFPAGAIMARRIEVALPKSRLIAIGVRETEREVLAWAGAGVSGYVPHTASIDELAGLIGQVCRGEQACPPRIAGGLLRRLAANARDAQFVVTDAPALTARQREVFRLVSAGLSNKDIARMLGISLGTTKAHVHAILGKLRLRRRAQIMTRMSGRD